MLEFQINEVQARRIEQDQRDYKKRIGGRALNWSPLNDITEMTGEEWRPVPCPRSRLTDRKVRAIKRALSQGATVHACSRRFDVVENTIKCIRSGKTWAHIQL